MNSIYEDNEWLAIRANTEENVNLINSLINDPDDFVEIDVDPDWETTVFVRSKEKNSNFIFLFEYMKPYDREVLNDFDVDIELLKKQFPNELIGFFYSCGMRPEESFTERMKYTDFFTDGDYAFAYCVGDVCGLKDFKVPSHWTSLKDMFYKSKPEGDTLNLSDWNVNHIIDFSRMFYACCFTKLILDNWHIGNPKANFTSMFNGDVLRKLSLRNWYLSPIIDEKYNYYGDNDCLILIYREFGDLVIDISGCDKHTALCLLSRFMCGYNWNIKFVIDEQSEVKYMYESFVRLLAENDNFSWPEDASKGWETFYKRREAYLSKLREFPFFYIDPTTVSDFYWDHHGEGYLDEVDWLIKSHFFRKESY